MIPLETSEQQRYSPSTSSQEELTYAEEQLGGASPSKGKLLGLPWNKEGTISVAIRRKQLKEVCCPINRIYDPLGLASPHPLYWSENSFTATFVTASLSECSVKSGFVC